jgi:hypothetical protein
MTALDILSRAVIYILPWGKTPWDPQSGMLRTGKRITRKTTVVVPRRATLQHQGDFKVACLG